MNLKTLSTRVALDKYKAVIDFIEVYKKKENIQLSLSQFVWNAIEYYIEELIRRSK